MTTVTVTILVTVKMDVLASWGKSMFQTGCDRPSVLHQILAKSLEGTDCI